MLTLVLRSLDEGVVTALHELAADGDAALGTSDTLTRDVRTGLEALSAGA